jgi:WD40 repeat protein
MQNGSMFLGKTMQNGSMFFTSPVFSNDGRRVVTASGDTASVWDAATGKPLGAPMQHQGPVKSAVFSSDGRRVVTASGDNTARVWDAATGKPLGLPMQHERTVNSAVFSSDGRRVVTASDDKTARVWQEPWSSINDSQELIRKACGSMNVEARRITREDVELVPLITAIDRKVGDDVCGSALNQFVAELRQHLFAAVERVQLRAASARRA